MKPSKHTNAPPISNMICFSVYSAGLAFNRLYQNLLEGFDLTYPQFLVLISLQQGGTMRVSNLGETLHLESNTLTPLLKRMEKAGLVRRTRSINDERVVQISLTKAGAKLTKDIGCVPPQVLEATHMGLRDVVALTSNLNGLSDNLRKHTQALRS
jgi:MarR family transcriptional regulator, organic hydroperoxide resistance regulator